MNSGRLVGIILIVVGFGVAVIAGLWLASQVTGGQLQSGGALVGGGIAFIPVALLTGFGIYMYVQGGKEGRVRIRDAKAASTIGYREESRSGGRERFGAGNEDQCRYCKEYGSPTGGVTGFQWVYQLGQRYSVFV